MGAEYFLLRLRSAHSGGPLHEKIKESIRLFGEEVIPACGYGNAAAKVGMTNEVERVETDA